MEPVTHMLFGAAMSRAGLNRKSGLATLTMVIAAELPDSDVLWYFAGSVEGFGHHRGITHTFLGAPFVAAAAVGIVYGYDRLAQWRRTRRALQGHNTPRRALPIRWPALYAMALLAAISHILLDFTNNYGVRPFFPFNPKWYSWDIVYIVDPLILAALFFALVLPALGQLVASEIGGRRPRSPGRVSAIAALVFIALLWWARDYQHRRALAMLDAQEYSTGRVLKTGANPYMLDLFAWHGVVETEGAFHLVPVETRSEAAQQDEAHVLYKPPENEWSRAAKATRLGRYYLDWARFPYAETDMRYAGNGAEVTIRDLRYMYPNGRPNLLGISVTLDSNKHVELYRMGNREINP